jgi:integral membrane protein
MRILAKQISITIFVKIIYMTNWFRKIAFVEGISLLVLLFIAMPFKYIWNYPYLVKYVGMIHGILFLLYIIFPFLLKEEKKWSYKDVLLMCLASVIPFGTFWVEKKYLK